MRPVARRKAVMAAWLVAAIATLVGVYGCKDRAQDEPAITANLERGTTLAVGCRTCHAITPEGANALGPTLWGVMDRRVASVQGFNYTPALRDVGGRWTPERLRRFLADPSGFAPGTTMQLTTSYSEEQLADLISYLQTLR